jgi:hypothetical protein
LDGKGDDAKAMMRTCEKCSVTYDDAVCWTICPHERFINDSDRRRKDLAFSLSGSPVRYKDKEEVLHIQSIDSRGFVTFREMKGQFDPKGLQMVPE